MFRNSRSTYLNRRLVYIDHWHLLGHQVEQVSSCSLANWSLELNVRQHPFSLGSGLPIADSVALVDVAQTVRADPQSFDVPEVSTAFLQRHEALLEETLLGHNVAQDVWWDHSCLRPSKHRSERSTAGPLLAEGRHDFGVHRISPPDGCVGEANTVNQCSEQIRVLTE